MTATNCRILLFATRKKVSPQIELYQDIEDKHIGGLSAWEGNSYAARYVDADYVANHLIPYLQMAYNTEKMKYLTVAVADVRDDSSFGFYAEMFYSI